MVTDELKRKYANKILEGMDKIALENFVYEALLENMEDADDDEILEEIEYNFPDLLTEE